MDSYRKAMEKEARRLERQRNRLLRPHPTFFEAILVILGTFILVWLFL